MKNSFTLLIVTILISFFSYISIQILQTKSLRNVNLQNQYLYIQAKNHKEFFKEFLLSKDLTNIENIRLKDNIFDIYAKIKPQDSFYKIDIFVKAKNYNISIYESIIKNY